MIRFIVLLFSFFTLNGAFAENVAPAGQSNSIANNVSEVPDNGALENQRMLEAAAKIMEVLNAQLEGDHVKLEKAANEAVALYNQILVANPANIKALNARASVKETWKEGTGAEDYKKAIELMTTAIAKNNKDAEVYYNRAVAYRGLKMYPEARADYQKAIVFNPDKSHWGIELKAMEAEAQ